METDKYFKPVVSVPKYLQIVEYLKEYIKNNKEKEKIPSEPLLCKKFNVSRNTVRDALAILVNEGIVERKQGKGTFIITSRSINIEFLIYQYPNPFSGFFLNEVYKGIKDAISSEKSIELFVNIREEGIYDVSSYIKRLGKQKIEGIILAGVFDRNFISKVKTEIPIVIVGKILPGENIDAVTPDAYNGVKIALKYLFELGHRKIVFLTSPLHHHGYVERLEAYEKLFVEFSQKYGSSAKPFFLIGEYSEISERLLKKRPFPDAVICSSDGGAFNFIKVAKRRGISIPRDISVIALDDVGKAEMSDPPVTVVNVLKREIGKKAIERLLEIIEKKSSKPKRIVVGNELIVRESVIRREEVNY